MKVPGKEQEITRKVIGKYQESTMKVPGKEQEITWKVIGKYQEIIGKVIRMNQKSNINN